jgi:cysteine desulfurase/selenocysteine lyase
VTRQYDWSVFSTIDTSHLKIVSLSLVSNVTGQILDLSFVKELSKICQMYFVVDASQAVPHFLVDVALLGADFMYFTGHKMGALT